MASEYTPNYNLDLYVATDKPNLRDQYNAAMRKVDQQLLAANTNATEAKASVLNFQTQLDAKASQADLTALSNTVSTKASQADLTALEEIIPASSFSAQNTVADNITSLGNRIAVFETTKHMVVIGDSYTHIGDGLSNQTQYWWYQLANKLGYIPHNYAQSGTGFIRGGSSGATFITQAQNAAVDSNYANSAVAAVYVLGGVNDTYQSTDVYSAVCNFIDYVKATFPNADIVIGGCNSFASLRFAGENLGTVTVAQTNRAVEYSIHNACMVRGVKFIPLSKVLVAKTNLFQSGTNGHPNVDGQKALLSAMLGSGPSTIDGGIMTVENGSGAGVVMVDDGGFHLYAPNVTPAVDSAMDNQYTVRFRDDYGLLQFFGALFGYGRVINARLPVGNVCQFSGSNVVYSRVTLFRASESSQMSFACISGTGDATALSAFI